MKELLVPVGSKEALIQAVYNHADAVYLAGKKYGARAFAPNFTETELIEAIKFCHLYNVRVYVTVNTMIYEWELKSIEKYIDLLVDNQVDALIISDLGLINFIHKKYPKLELHASTQMHIYNARQIAKLKKLGITRVVLARELSIDEINKLPDDMEYEVFIHGALCVCYSGLCLMSYMSLNRSGNRGCCAGLCRYQYDLYYHNKQVVTDGAYLLSTKELNTSDYIKQLLDSKITSFKIEGRMKSPEYVGFITKYYYNLIHNHGKTTETQINNLKVLYNRDFTKGYLFNEENIMNFKTSNHQGVTIGKVINVNKKKIKILLSKDLKQEDGIRFVNENKGLIVNFLYNEDGKLIREAKRGMIVFVDNKINLQTLDIVNKTLDKDLIENLQKIKPIKINLTGIVKVTLEDLQITISDKTTTISEKFKICQRAINKAITKEDIKKHMERLNDTPFIFSKLDILVDDNVFIVISKLNEARRISIEKFIEAKINNYRK